MADANHYVIALQVQQAWTSRTMNLSNEDAVKVLELVHQQLERDLESHRAWAAEEAGAGDDVEAGG